VAVPFLWLRSAAARIRGDLTVYPPPSALTSPETAESPVANLHHHLRKVN
jgi:hypothetical protein